MTDITKKPPMDEQRFVTKFINPLGETRWQPTLPNGMRAWMPTVRMHPWDIDWETEADTHPYTIQGPRVYRSRARAARVARRKWVRVVEHQWKEA